MNRMDKLISEMKEAVSDNWADLKSRFGIDDKGMETLAAVTHYGTVADMTDVTPLEVYQNDPSSFISGLREANPDLMETPDEDIVAAVTGEATSFSAENWRRKHEDDDPFGDWGPMLQCLGIDQIMFDAIANEVGYETSADMIAMNPSPLDLPEETLASLLGAILGLVPGAQGRNPEELKDIVLGINTEGV